MDKLYNNLDELLQNRVFYHFSELSRVPRPSFHEEQVSEWLYQWAKTQHLEAIRDEHNNVLIRKPASPGREQEPTVLLQAHMDMVCEKAPGVTHDFMRDPIRLVLEGDLLTTGGATTLGADNGIGIAYILTILESDALSHPPLEALLTTAEEEDFSGALGFDAMQLRAKYLINLDHACDSDLLVGSCGGMGVELALPAPPTPLPQGCKSFTLSISGLPGGHSGEDIHRGHGNANILLGRLLHHLHEVMPLHLCALHGGSFRLAIPRDAQATVAVEAARVSALKEQAAVFAATLRAEYAVVAPALQITLSECETPAQALSEAALAAFLRLLYLSPDGISGMNGAVPGTVECSDNLGELRLEDGVLRLVYELRSSHDSSRVYLYEKLQMIAELTGASCRAFSAYPGWAFDPGSHLRQVATSVYERLFSIAPGQTVVHAGIECGCFFVKRPDLDAIAIGPNAWGFHSPTERVSISSTERVWGLLTALIEALHD